MKLCNGNTWSNTLQKQPLEVFYIKKVLLEISQNSQENTCARVSFLLRLQAFGPIKTLIYSTISENSFPTKAVQILIQKIYGQIHQNIYFPI